VRDVGQGLGPGSHKETAAWFGCSVEDVYLIDRIKGVCDQKVGDDLLLARSRT
jgi:hypothetical protein